MAITNNLIALGLPAEIAKRVGVEIISVTTTGTTQGSTGGALSGPGNKVVLATPHAGDGAVTLPANADIGDVIEIVNMHASNNVDVFPPTGHSIHKLSANGGTPVATGQSFIARYVGLVSSAGLWVGRVVATPAAT